MGQVMRQQNHVFIEPESCGSGVGYYLSVNEYTRKDTPVTYSMSATVVLTDCAHKIDWQFEDEGTEKIDAAITMLQEFRKKLVETAKVVKRLNK